MHNLYKQYNVVDQSREIRMINSNAAVEAKMAELQKKMRQQDNPAVFQEGFSSGLVAERVEVIPEEDPQETAEKAKAEAEELLENARKQAEEMVAKAKADAEQILEQAQKNGYEKGYEEALKQAEEEMKQHLASKEAELLERQTVMEQEYQAEMEYLEPKLLDAILQVVNKVFHVQFDDKKEILLYLVQNTVQNIEGSSRFRIRVGDAQRFFIENHKEEIMEHVGKDVSVEIVSDALLDGDDCIIETDTGIFECGLGVQLENLMKDLKALTM